jgi:hypothetical protein
MGIKLKRSHWVECREGEVLAVHKQQVGPEAAFGAFLASFYSCVLS